MSLPRSQHSVLNALYPQPQVQAILQDLEGLHKGSQVPQAGTASRESQLVAIAPPDSYGRHDNAKSKREFKKLSKCMGDKLDKEKGSSIEELAAPVFKSSHLIEIFCQRVEEKECSREASQNAKPGTIKRMQLTFSIDQPPPVTGALCTCPR
ncbi:uncharacterized protein EV420DRAFT_1639222 [Desarmillaria tabescens]|uniref:Uncharacterized protein n=1 Tax=Armillaria tabescens TaxID=1929756 RepID=A0AA39TLC4_ARMTA|nr:uncharacterized protein EV420DRAFT_1639222 [Desarmillaria tabescens]KAK0463137.1 hypothetical protein EV420DRAFT_1639222 [Desarmillaria tabescens]